MKTSNTRKKMKIGSTEPPSRVFRPPPNARPGRRRENGNRTFCRTKVSGVRCRPAGSGLLRLGLGEPLQGRDLERVEVAALDGGPRPSGQVEEEADVVLGEEHEAEDLLLVDQMAQVGAGEAGARPARAVLLKRAGIPGEAGVSQVQPTLP